MLIKKMTDATEEQKKKLHHLFLESFPDKYQDLGKFLRLVEKRADMSYFFETDKKVSALIINEMLDQKHLHIFFICVGKAYRGLGLGKQLVLHLEQKMKKRSGNLITAEMKAENNDASRFYSRLGFSVMKGDELSSYLRKRGRDAFIQGEKIYVKHKGERIEKVVMKYEIPME
jgi:ribosomal protein S18 acetylase RimI-like enzyme